ncbi:MAG: radical SAM family heme chaperone HemW [Anaerolineae bacterium]|nr:radical SAM family heme chaperone HemW [Anaerolineae bacterium]
MIPYSIYLHIPFCHHRCGYCDFNTYAGLDDLIPDYTRALEREIRSYPSIPVHTIFFGGGTPSLLAPSSIDRLLKALQETFDILPNAEITLEANPGTLSKNYLKALRTAGVNRLSLGMQSSHPQELAILERSHSMVDVFNAVDWARYANIDNLSLDLIYGLPYQNIDLWAATLTQALEFFPEHLSLYALTLEHGTPLKQQVARGKLPDPDPDLAASMYELAAAKLSSAGYQQYEISNWAKTPVDVWGSQHNLQYWRNLPYLGLGAGAHGFAEGSRTVNVLSPQTYINRLKERNSDRALIFPRSQATISITPVDKETEIGETMMMGLRLTHEGVSAEAFKARFNQSLQDVFGDEIKKLIGLELLTWKDQALCLTPRGRLLGNQVFMHFV